jgi:hypothetical protein
MIEHASHLLLVGRIENTSLSNIPNGVTLFSQRQHQLRGRARICASVDLHSKRISRTLGAAVLETIRGPRQHASPQEFEARARSSDA